MGHAAPSMAGVVTQLTTVVLAAYLGVLLLLVQFPCPLYHLSPQQRPQRHRSRLWASRRQRLVLALSPPMALVVQGMETLCAGTGLKVLVVPYTE